MYKKIISTILIIALINLLGCYSFKSITVPEYKQIEEEDQPVEIYVKAENSNEYHFSETNFYIENDTLYEKVNTRELSIGGKIPFSEIASIQFEDFDSKNSSPMSVSQYQKIEAENGKPDEIYLTKLDSTRYQFMKDDYWIKNDILYGKGKLLLSDREQPPSVQIALSNIESIQIEQVDGLSTVVAVLVAIGIVGVIALIISTSYISFWDL